MPKQEELAFIKAIVSIEVSPEFVQELKKPVAARKKKKALAVKASVERPHGVGEDRTSRDSPLIASKRKAEELSSSDCPSEPDNRRPAPWNMFDDGPEAQNTTGEQAALSSRKLGSTEGRLAYASVAAGVASQQQPSGPHNSTAKGSVPNKPAASSETATRRMSLVDVLGPLCGMPDGATPNAQVVINTSALEGERQNKNPIYVTEITDTRDFLTWLRASSQSGLSAQMKGEKLMLVPCTAEGFRAIVSVLRSLDWSKGVGFHTFSLTEEHCVRLLIKKLGRHMPEDVVREELENLGIRVQGVLQLWSGRRDQAAETRPLTAHFIVSVARGPDVANVRTMTEPCGLRITVETTLPPRDPCSASDENPSGIRSFIVAMHPDVLSVDRLTSQKNAPTHTRSSRSTVVDEITRPATGAVRSGKKRRRRLLCWRRSTAVKGVAHRDLPPSRQRWRSRPQNRRSCDLAGTTLSVGPRFQGRYNTRPPLPLPVQSLKIHHGMR